MSSRRSKPSKPSAASSAALERPPLSRRFGVLGTVFITGASVMVVEILGTRVIGPVFGVSLFVWAALLAVTLASLATGYYVGGILADRRPRPELLGTVEIASGLLLALTPATSYAILSMSQELGARGGPLVSATLLFAPALTALGMIGPIAVKLALADVGSAGQVVGGVYAASTVGSLIGTLVTGFVLIPSFETDHILVGTAVLLIALGVVSLAGRRLFGSLLVVVPPLALLVPAPALPPGTHILARASSMFGLVEVIDDRARAVRFMRADHSVIGAEFTADHTAGFAFLHMLEALRFMRPAAQRMLQIGLGIGSLPRVLERHGLTADAVEIDPIVARFARDYFAFHPAGDVFVQDARAYLNMTQRTYDIVVHDTFTGGSTPEHLLSIELLRRARAVLRPQGVLALNFVGYADASGATAAVARTLRSLFAHVRAFAEKAKPGEPGVTNIVFFATDGPLDITIPSDPREFESAACRHTLRSLPELEVLQSVPDGPLITDQWNPLARMQLRSAEEHYAAMNVLLPKRVWLH